MILRWHVTRGAGARLLCACVLGLSLLPTGVPAQLTTLRFRTWGLDDGMTHDAVFTVQQDRSGIIRVGTQDGLLEFDGETFESIRHDLEDPESLSDDHVMAIHDDGRGGLWIGTWTGWLNRVDRASGQIDRIAPPAELPMAAEGFGGEVVDAIVDVGDGVLGLATDLGALAYDPVEGRYRHLDPGAAAEGGDPRATAIMVAPDSVIWIGYADGRLRRLEHTAPHGEKATTVAEIGAEVSVIRRGEDHRIWVGSRGRGVFAVDALGGAVLDRFHADADPDHRLPGNRVQDLLVGREGDLWVATLSGLGSFPAGGGDPTHFVHDDSDPWSLPSNLVLSLLEDRQGVLWVGTFSGLGRVHPHDLAFARVQRRTADREGVAGAGVLAIVDAGLDRVWVGTQGGGLDRLDLRTGAATHWPPDPGGTAGPSHGEVKSLAVDPGGDLWIATMGGGVNRFDPGSDRFDRIPMESSGPASAAQSVTSVLVDRLGTVWAGTRADGLHRFDPGSGVFRRYRGPDGSWTFGGEYVWPIVEDREGNLWVGAVDGGLTRIDADRASATLYTSDNSGLHSDLILTLYEGPEGHIWIGTEGAGLVRLDPETETFESYTTRDGLPHNNVQAVRADGDGNLWVSTNDGLARMDPSGTFTRYGHSVGLHGRRFYANAALGMRNGRIVFGGEGGLTVVTPDRLRAVEEPSDVVLTGFSVSGEPRAVRSGERIELGPTENFFAFRFAATDYADPGRVAYRYRLDPLDDDWVDNGNAKLANYTSVPPGEYVFRVSARNSFGIPNEDALSLPIVVHGPFHATWWFRSLALVALVSLLTAAYGYRLKQILRLQELRFAIAGKLHDEIGANLGAIALKSESVRARGDLDQAAREQLAAVSRIARETNQELRETLWVVSTKYDSLQGLFTKLRDAADMLLDRSVECDYTMSPAPPSQPIDMQVRQAVYLLYKEALHNVAKHADAGRVEIDVSYARPTLTLSIRDDGKGFDPDTVEEGNGLPNMVKRAEMIGGDLRIESSPGQGTRIRLAVRVT